ncbi:hypothetical protein BRC81_07265 [Halobacteriales archaeon QS_1_68_20]|nr:MAG: hypothetical protein BRC81_07265 [Halobacteriales archaeon QS_1_68_20]
MAPESADPRSIRSIAVTASDVVAAFEANREGGPRTVLRVTPPFSGMMRARLHRLVDDRGDAETEDTDPGHAGTRDADPGDVGTGDERTGPEPVHVDPADLLSDAVPPYPHPDETEEALRADPEASYTPERHHERHQQAVEDWRERARANLADAVTVQTPDGPHEVEVTVLGGRR